jgi:hypothetical protein
MRIRGLIIVAALTLLTACASSLPVRDFRADFERPSARSTIKIEGYPSFGVAELRNQRRLRVEVLPLAALGQVLTNPFIWVGVTDGIPSLSAHQAAARAFLAETGRGACTLEPVAVTPSGREFEFRYSCQGGA